MNLDSADGRDIRTRKAFGHLGVCCVSIPLPFIPLPLFRIQPACPKWQGNKRQGNEIRMAGKVFFSSLIGRTGCS